MGYFGFGSARMPSMTKFSGLALPENLTEKVIEPFENPF
jgi:hypothetical protein